MQVGSSTVGGCGDVNRNIMCTPAPIVNKPEYGYAQQYTKVCARVWVMTYLYAFCLGITQRTHEQQVAHKAVVVAATANFAHPGHKWMINGYSRERKKAAQSIGTLPNACYIFFFLSTAIDFTAYGVLTICKCIKPANSERDWYNFFLQSPSPGTKKEHIFFPRTFFLLHLDPLPSIH